MDTFRLKEIRAAAILGAGHGIGLALAQTILSECSDSQVFASYRQRNQAESLLHLKEIFPDRLTIACVEPTEETSLTAFCQDVSRKTSQIDMIINCVGVLHDSYCQPEKSLSQITLQKLSHSFAVNAAITPLLAKIFLPLIRKSPISLFSSISAKVGSIEDNRLGGWYGYRASKAALNMFIKNIAVEFSNRSIPCIALSLHPGTTKTSLSEPYIKNSKLRIHSPSQAASNILSVIDNKTLRDTGKFFSWDGSEIPW